MFDFYLRHEYWFAATQLALAMVGMGAKLTLADFREIAREPKAFSIGMALQLLFVPLVAWFFIRFVGVPAGVAVGLAVCATVPGATVSTIFTLLGRGNVPLAITLTGVTTIACLVITPVLLGLLIQQYMPADFRMPVGRIAFEIGVCLLIPLVAGMAYLRAFPATAPVVSRWGVRGSLFVIGLIIVGSLGAGRLNLAAFGVGNTLLVLGFIAVLALGGWTLPRLLGLQRADNIAIGLNITVRNTNLGLLIKASLFPAVVGQPDPLGDTVLFAILLYGGLMLAAGGTAIGVIRRSARITT
jgi:bile acid:Na+ symporter, BASS family